MKQTLRFLKKLTKNNDRDWFKANKDEFDAAREEFSAHVQKTINGIARFDPDMKDTLADDCIFRIYRDVRFSKDKSPYKTAFGASMQPDGKNSGVPGYYLHVSPGEIMVAGGSYRPHGEELKNIREAIARDLKGFKKIVEAKKFKDLFGELHGEQLKTAPKGYPKDHEAIEYLRYKGFTAFQGGFTQKLATSDEFMKETLKSFRAMKPLNLWLRDALD